MNLHDLAEVEQGFILLYGPRRSGKTHACDVFLRRWCEQDLPFAHFSLTEMMGARPPVGRYRWHRAVTTQRVRGHCRYLVDDVHMTEEDAPLQKHQLCVLATSEVQPWMQRADWIIRLSAPATIEVEKYSEGGLLRRQPPRTLWDRLLDDGVVT